MVTIEEILIHPLFLLLAGVGVSSIPIALLTNHLEDRRKIREIEVERKRKEFDIKVDIVAAIGEVTADVAGKTNTTIGLRKKRVTENERAATYDDLEKWYIESTMIQTKLAIYFSEADLAEKWNIFIDVIVGYYSIAYLYFLEAPTELQRKTLKLNIEKIRNYFSDDNQIDWDRFTTEMTYDPVLWRKISELIMVRANEIAEEILSLPIKEFGS